MYIHRHIETLSRNHCCLAKARSITHSECVSVALVIQHAKRMRRIILSSVACLMCVLIFCTNLSETFLTLGRIQRTIIINVHRSEV